MSSSSSSEASKSETGRRIYVTGYSSKEDSHDMKKIFKKYGKIEEFSWKGKYFFITYEHNDEAKKAIRKMNKEDVNGYTLIAEFARQKKRNDGSCYACGRMVPGIVDIRQLGQVQEVREKRRRNIRNIKKEKIQVAVQGVRQFQKRKKKENEQEKIHHRHHQNQDPDQGQNKVVKHQSLILNKNDIYQRSEDKEINAINEENGKEGKQNEDEQ